MVTMHIGFDDTDSPRKGCTTYVASLLVERLNDFSVRFVDYPNLVRLNPNVPWKTRGNGALCLRFCCSEDHVAKIKETAISIVEQNSDLEYRGTEPGVVFFTSSAVPVELKVFAKQAIQGIVKMKTALKLTNKFGAEAVGFKTGRGIIGALAAVGEDLSSDHTYELIAYRKPAKRGKPRQIDATSVFEMDRKTKSLTFNNVDPKTKRILITPHGPDPILYGIRGETASAVRRAHRMIRSLEPIERWTIFRTNHGTDAHLRTVAAISDVHPFNPVVVKGTVSQTPLIVPRRHVVFTISDQTGHIDCAAYEPTQELPKAAKQLLVGDVVEAHGGVRPASAKTPITVNLEKIRVLKLAPHVVLKNPLCPNCGKRMESMGADKGFRCERCGFRSSTMRKLAVEERRDLQRGLYVTAPRSQRHLTKPLDRYGLEKSSKSRSMISNWFWVNTRFND